MRLRSFFLCTSKTQSGEAVLQGHRYLLQAGLATQNASGIYTLLPLGMRVVRKIEAVVRKHMDPISAEIRMPMLQPLELWEKSGRDQIYGPELWKTQDRHDRPFCLGPTHEEIITDLVARFVQGHKQMPASLYQIQTKVRDEIRPRYGLMRAREFIMKDAYSFDLDEQDAQAVYQSMRKAYQAILEEVELDYCIVKADGGQIGGSQSEEFQALAEAGEDRLVINDQGTYAANIEVAPCPKPDPKPALDDSPASIWNLSNPSLEAQAKQLQAHYQALDKPCDTFLKTLLVQGTKAPVALVLRASDSFNPTKAEKHPWVHAPLTLLDPSKLAELGLPKGYIGPSNGKLGSPIKLQVLADYAAAAAGSLCAGANEEGALLLRAKWGQELSYDDTADLRELCPNEPSPDGQGLVCHQKGIEVGHIFLLGQKYSQAMELQVQNDQGESIHPVMGCYGFGVTRLLQAFIEQHHDEKGIKWSLALAPFQVVVAPLMATKDSETWQAALSLYEALKQAKIDVALDDRPLRVGEMLSDLELIGIPYQIIIGKKSLAEAQVELVDRRLGTKQLIAIDQALPHLSSLLSNDA